MFVVAAALVWAALAWTGYDLYRLTKARVPRSPYLPGQLLAYVLVPLASAFVGGFLAFVLRRHPRWGIAIGVAGFVLLAAVLPFLIGYSGGV